MTRHPRAPAPSPKIFAELLEQLPSTLLQDLVSRAGFTCLLRELAELDQAITASDLVQRSLATSGQEPPIAVEARRREDRAFRRVSVIAASLLELRPTALHDAVLTLLLIVASGQPGPSQSGEFPWRQLRRLLAALAEL